MRIQGSASPRCPDLEGSRSGETHPDDFFRMMRGRTAARGEARLALAVLEEAVRCLEGGQESWYYPPHLFRREAEQWIASRDRGSLYSFENICAILGADADELRARIRRWRAERRQELARLLVRSSRVRVRIPAASDGAPAVLAPRFRREAGTSQNDPQAARAWRASRAGRYQDDLAYVPFSG